MDSLAKWLIQPRETVLIPIIVLVVAAFAIAWLHESRRRRTSAGTESMPPETPPGPSNGT